jgi:hypothetical protein
MTLDPLSNVSSLSYLKIVSMNQNPTPSYWNAMIKDETLASADRKRQIADAYVEKHKDSVLSSLSSGKDSFMDYKHSDILSFSSYSDKISQSRSELIDKFEIEDGEIDPNFS